MIKIEKKVQFDLSGSKVFLSSKLIDEGYAKADVIALFVELDEFGYGDYVPGTRGRGTCAKFTKNDSCPAEYTLVMEQKPRGRKPNQRVEKNEESSVSSRAIEIQTCENSPVDGQMDEVAQIMNDGDLCECVEDSADDEVQTCMIDSDADLTGVASDLAMIRNDDDVEIDESLFAQDEEIDECEAAE